MTLYPPVGRGWVFICQNMGGITCKHTLNVFILHCHIKALLNQFYSRNRKVGYPEQIDCTDSFKCWFSTSLLFHSNISRRTGSKQLAFTRLSWESLTSFNCNSNYTAYNPGRHNSQLTVLQVPFFSRQSQSNVFIQSQTTNSLWLQGQVRYRKRQTILHKPVFIGNLRRSGTGGILFFTRHYHHRLWQECFDKIRICQCSPSQITETHLDNADRQDRQPVRGHCGKDREGTSNLSPFRMGNTILSVSRKHFWASLSPILRVRCPWH
jgi:hypothetical protein